MDRPVRAVVACQVQGHLQNRGAIAASVAVRAAQVDIGEELHLHVLEAGPAAGGAASVAGVEAEGPGGVAALPGQGCGGEALADRVQGADIAGRVGARGAADGGLVQQQGVGDQLVALDRPRARPGASLGRPLALARAR